MALSDEQIERYSRQILVAGGIAQERLLASRIVIGGAANEIDTAMRYLLGSGVGTIGLDLIGERVESGAQLITRTRELNSDVAIQSEEFVARPDLRLLIVSNASVLAAVKSQKTWDSAVVLVRLDSRAKIAILPDHDHSAVGLEKKLFAPWSPAAPHESVSGNAGFVTMVALTEVLKLLTLDQVPAESVLIEFDGYQTKTPPLSPH